MTRSQATSEDTPLEFEANSHFGLNIPFMRYLGLRPDSLTSDLARTYLPANDQLVNSRNEVHGGTLMSVLDFTLTAAARGHDPLNYGVATIEMSTHFLAAARGDLIIEARVLRRGRSIAFCEGTVYNASGTAVCTSRATLRLIALNP